jgi:hypothetical protein
MRFDVWILLVEVGEHEKQTKSHPRSLYTTYTYFTKVVNPILYIYVFEILLYTLCYVKENIKGILLLDID